MKKSHNAVSECLLFLYLFLQLVIPVTSVQIVKKQNTALLVPNALSIRTTEGEKVRGHFLSCPIGTVHSPTLSATLIR